MPTAMMAGAAFAVGVAVAALPRQGQAHPHAWIDLRTKILFDGGGAMTGLQEDWLLDDFMSVTVLEELGDGIDARDADTLQRIGATILRNVADYGYFTEIKIDGAAAPLTLDRDFSAQMRADRLAITFTMQLNAPADPRRHVVAYSVYDPTYFTEVLHTEMDDPILLSGTVPEGCQPTIQHAAPSPADIAAAAALDVTESGGDRLGQLFAERVLLTCP
jgi:ABC-type uncharacterized transport system substrate-binding protein